MSNQGLAGIYLFVDFEWPRPFKPEHGAKAMALHVATQEAGWIREVVAASGGIGGWPPSVWVFWLESYAALDRLLRDPADPIGQAYSPFFSEMPTVNERIREEVVFRSA